MLSNQTPGKQFTYTGGKNNFMHLRAKNNRSGMYSMDRGRGVAVRGGKMFPETANGGVRANYAATKDSKFQYNSTSIPYLNKGQAGGV